MYLTVGPYIHQKRICTPEISANLFYICNVTFKIGARAERHVIGTRGNSRLKKAKPSSSRRSHRKTYRPAEARMYHKCVELAIFIREDSVHLKLNFLTHRMINFVVATGCRWPRPCSISHAHSPAKLARAFSRLGWRWLRYLPPR